MLLIVINAVILGLETVPAAMESYGPLLIAIDQFILGVFVIEILIRIYAHRLAFFRDPWSLFDFVVVAIALVPASGPLAVLRAARVAAAHPGAFDAPCGRGPAGLDTGIEFNRAGVVVDLLRVCRDCHQVIR